MMDTRRKLQVNRKSKDPPLMDLVTAFKPLCDAPSTPQRQRTIEESTIQQ